MYDNRDTYLNSDKLDSLAVGAVYLIGIATLIVAALTFIGLWTVIGWII